MKRYLLLLLLFNNPVLANSVNTTSNSSGSVVNQAVQVVPSRQFQYQMNTITCQGATLNISPFVSTTYGFATPFESHFDRPVYSRRDIEGNFDDDNNAIGDGDVDAGYRGEIMAAVDNIKEEDYTIEYGARLFQIVAMDGSPLTFELVSELSKTKRGFDGFGSTGI